MGIVRETVSTFRRAKKETSMLEWFKSTSAVQVPFLQMTLWAFIAFVICVTVLIQLGTRWHGDYEYYGNARVLYLGPTCVAFMAPVVVAWWRAKSKTTKK